MVFVAWALATALELYARPWELLGELLSLAEVENLPLGQVSLEFPQCGDMLKRTRGYAVSKSSGSDAGIVRNTYHVTCVSGSPKFSERHPGHCVDDIFRRRNIIVISRSWPGYWS